MPKLVTDVERQQKRRAILDAAATEIACYAYERANINSIAERAGIGRGTIYLYFDSKDEVLRELLNTMGAMIDSTIRACLVSALPWEDRLFALCKAFVALAERHRDFFRVHVSTLHGVNRDIGAPVAQWLSTSAHRLAEAFEQSMGQGNVVAMPWRKAGDTGPGSARVARSPARPGATLLYWS